jgi:hypothetical protein
MRIGSRDEWYIHNLDRIIQCPFQPSFSDSSINPSFGAFGVENSRYVDTHFVLTYITFAVRMAKCDRKKRKKRKKGYLTPFRCGRYK